MRYAFSILLVGSAVALAQPPATPDAAATVNGESISLAEIDAVLKHTLPLTPLTAAQRRQMRVEVLSDMIDDAQIARILAMPDVSDRLSKLGADVVAGPPAEFAAYLQTEIVKWTQVIKAAGVTAE